MKPSILQNKKLVALVVALILVLGAGVWAAFYFNLFEKDELAKGPVVLKKEAPPETTAPYKIESVVTGLNVPWSLVFTSDKRWLVSERPGSLRVVENGVLKPAPLARFDVSSGGEEGLMGLALDPDYANNHLVYACYAVGSGNPKRSSGAL